MFSVFLTFRATPLETVTESFCKLPCCFIVKAGLGVRMQQGGLCFCFSVAASWGICSSGPEQLCSVSPCRRPRPLSDQGLHAFPEAAYLWLAWRLCECPNRRLEQTLACDVLTGAHITHLVEAERSLQSSACWPVDKCRSLFLVLTVVSEQL